jgi:hypothetical protein
MREGVPAAAARRLNDLILNKNLTASKDPCGEVGHFAASPSSRRSRVRPPHSYGSRSSANFSARSPDTHTDMRRKPAFFMRLLYSARCSALVVKIPPTC